MHSQHVGKPASAHFGIEHSQFSIWLLFLTDTYRIQDFDLCARKTESSHPHPQTRSGECVLMNGGGFIKASSFPSDPSDKVLDGASPFPSQPLHLPQLNSILNLIDSVQLLVFFCLFRQIIKLITNDNDLQTRDGSHIRFRIARILAFFRFRILASRFFEKKARIFIFFRGFKMLSKGQKTADIRLKNFHF